MNLTVKNGGFHYQKQTPIFNDIHFSVDSGEILAILGPNGAGKTTMLRCITGMLKWKQGQSLLDGEPIQSMPAQKLWRSMAYVPQAKSASSAYTAFETVLLGRSSRLNPFSVPKREDLEKAMEAMEMLGIAHLAEKKCSAISGGELQMVLIARALASEPQVLILDEPESNLDFKNQLVVLDAITRLAQSGMTCIFNTHYPAHALQRADKALILSRGGDYVFGATSAIVTEENIRKAFGVEAVIGQIETPENQLTNVIPLSIATRQNNPEDTRNKRSIATITIIANSNHMSGKINGLLHEYGAFMVGRMGMPYRECSLYLINVTLDGPRETILELSHRLNILPDVSVKTTFAKGNFETGSAKEGSF